VIPCIIIKTSVVRFSSGPYSLDIVPEVLINRKPISFHYIKINNMVSQALRLWIDYRYALSTLSMSSLRSFLLHMCKHSKFTVVRPTRVMHRVRILSRQIHCVQLVLHLPSQHAFARRFWLVERHAVPVLPQLMPTRQMQR
jgi:hypothetical protein